MGHMELARADITQQEVDAVVNAANAGLYPGGGVCEAIHRAGGAALTEECLAYPGHIVHADTQISLSPGQARAVVQLGAIDKRISERLEQPEDITALAIFLSGLDIGVESADAIELSHAIDALGDGLAFQKRRFYTERCRSSEVRVTTAGDMPARYCLHATGPIWQGGARGESGQLAAVHRRIMELASEYDCASIALPAISTGIFGFPMTDAAEIATREIHSALEDHPSVDLVRFCVIDDDTETAYTRALEKM